MRFPTGWGIGFAGDAVVPPEVCVIIPGTSLLSYPTTLMLTCFWAQGQLYRKKVPPANMKTVLDFSAKNPRDRLQIIEQGINSSVSVPSLSKDYSWLYSLIYFFPLVP